MLKRFLFVVAAAILSAGSLIGAESAAASPAAATPKVYTAQVTIFCGFFGESDETNASPRNADRFRQLQMSQMLINDYRALFDSEYVQSKIENVIVKEFSGFRRGVGVGRYSVVMEGRPDCRVLTIVAKSDHPSVALVAAQTGAEIFKAMVRDVLKLDNVRIIGGASIVGDNK